MTILAGKNELHFAPIGENSSISIKMGILGYAIVHQNDELIDIIDNKYVSDVLKQIKEFEPKSEIMLIQ